MKVLVVGGGGREHALGWKIKQSKTVREVYFAPGNGGTQEVGTNLSVKGINEIVKWCQANKPDLVVVGPDNYLKDGIVDKLKKIKIKVFGPNKKAARIEWSKSYCKKLLQKYKIPTANFKVFSNKDLAVKYLRTQSYPIVIKYDGLAFGKGVEIVNNLKEGNTFLDKVLASTGDKVVIEEFMTGREISVHFFTDGKNYSIFPVSKDHKRIFDGNKGPNTGGMGTVSRLDYVSKKDIGEIETKIVKPLMAMFKKEKIDYVGVVYPGIMLTSGGPKIIEINARFGDPETQTYMRMLETDITNIFLGCIDRKLDKIKVSWSKENACCVVLASDGYPNKYNVGKEISISKKISGVEIFHSGTKVENGKILTNGGRVLGVTAKAASLSEALKKAYLQIQSINFDEKYYRKDLNQ
jgi:phosphoribosylamine--glycine ligase